MPDHDIFVYVGCYTVERTPPDRFVPEQGAAKGIRVFRAKTKGAWELIQEVEQLNPMYLNFSPDQQTLYAASSDSSLVWAYRVDRKSGLLSPLGSLPAHGKSTLCLSVSPDGHYLVVGTMSGAMTCIRLRADGSLGEVCEAFQLEGTAGPLRDEQPWPRPHHCPFGPGGRCYIVDKGADKVDVCELLEDGRLPVQSRLIARPGSIPRHIAFHPSEAFAYINTEHVGTVIACRVNPLTGELTAFQILPTIPEDYVGNYSLSSEIALHPGGRWLYISNRGHDSIAVFAVDEHSGRLTALGWQHTHGEIPRFFAIEPAGNFLYAANQKSGTIKEFSIDQTTGLLEYTGVTVQTPTPVWMLFSPGRSE